MKHQLLGAALLFSAVMSPSAIAQTTSTAVSGSESESNSASIAGALNEGNTTTITFEGPEATVIPRDRYQAPNAIAPSFGAAGINVCAGGGASFGLSLPGGGFAGGAGREDEGCDLARLTQSMRLGGTSIERAGAAVINCLNDERAEEAFQALGFTCAQLGQEIISELGASTPVSFQASTPTAEMLASPSRPVADESRGDELYVRYAQIQGPAQ